MRYAVFAAGITGLIWCMCVMLFAQEGEGKVSGDGFTGRCHCGAIQYKVSGTPLKCDTCDCAGCRRASGSPKGFYVIVRGSDITFTGGKPANYRADSPARCDKDGAWYFCPTCGSPLYWKPDRGNEYDLFAGTLDDPAVFKPEPAK